MNNQSDWNDLRRSWVDDVIDSQPGILEDIQQWWRSSSPIPMVGSRHHTVPRSYLARFSAAGRIHVRDRDTGIGSLRNIKDTGAIRDFYTFINGDGERDGRLERILSDIESAAKTTFDRMLNPLLQSRSLAPDDHLNISVYLAFQLVRTPRHRREVELMGDYLVRSTHATQPGITQVRAVPEPNLHLDYLAKAGPKLAEALFDRPVTLLTIDQPLFITCDEAVILLTEDDADHVRHLPSCFKTQRQRQRSARKPRRQRRTRHVDTIHTYTTRPGVGQASEVAIPLTPHHLLVLGPRGAPQEHPHRRAEGDDASTIAEDVNTRLLTHAYLWVAAHPAHPTFTDVVFPAPRPIIQVCDGNTSFARDLDRPPTPRQPQLLGRRGQRPT
jgi:hypothetical protein